MHGIREAVRVIQNESNLYPDLHHKWLQIIILENRNY